MKLFHAADIHLGRRRLDGRLPDKDLADAFNFVAGEAIREKADAFLIAGDLFDRPQVEPPHLRQAQQVLSRLKEASIPVIAIEGNHDKAFVHSDSPTWLNYLAEEDLLILLRTHFGATGPLLASWNPVNRSGSWYDLQGIRFVGVGYLGAATPHKVREVVNRLEAGRPHVLLMHAGPEYFVGEGGGFSRDDLVTIGERVCYLALGHIHKPMRYQNWACNPGSLENCDLREAATEGPRGFAVVELDSAHSRPLSIEIRNNPRRPCHRVDLDCTEFGNKLKKGAETLVDAAVDQIKARRLARETVVELRLTGHLNLDRIALDQALACAEIEKAAGVSVVAFDTSGLNLEAMSVNGQLQAPQDLTRESIERASIRKLLEGENLWGLDGRQDDFAGLFYELKELVRLGKSGEDLADTIGQNPLVALIQKANQDHTLRETRDQRDKWKEAGESAAKGFDQMVDVAEAQTEALKI